MIGHLIKNSGWRCGSCGKSTCLADKKPEVQTPVLKKTDKQKIKKSFLQ
jgi:hypothetical protein